MTAVVEVFGGILAALWEELEEVKGAGLIDVDGGWVGNGGWVWGRGPSVGVVVVVVDDDDDGWLVGCCFFGL